MAKYFLQAGLVVFLLAFSFNALAGEQPPRRPQVPGPGDVTAPQPIPSNINDLSFLPTITEDGLGPAKTPQQVASVVQIVIMLTFLGLAPSLLLMMTCFTMVLIVFSFVRRALGTQTMPPDQLLVGLGLFITVFIMYPTWNQSWEEGLKPYLHEAIDPMTGEVMTQKEMFERILAPQRYFMVQCLETNSAAEEVQFFLGVSGHQQKDSKGRTYWVGDNGRRVDKFGELRPADIPTIVLIPAFIASELKRGFWMGFLLYLPFLILDMVIASVLMSMGMMMLPPVMISLPFKLIMFILVDGWRLLLEALVTSFPQSVLIFAPVVS